MIGHDLIEQVGGIEKAREIVGGASFGTHYRVDTGEVICCHNESHFYFTDLVKLGVEFIRIDDLRTAIAQYEQLGNSEEFKAGDKIIFSAMGNSVMEYQDCLKMFLSQGLIRHATPAEIAAGHRLDKKIESDDVRDICNHISPNMKVVEL